MKKILFLMSIAILASCSGRNSEKDLQEKEIFKAILEEAKDTAYQNRQEEAKAELDAIMSQSAADKLFLPIVNDHPNDKNVAYVMIKASLSAYKEMQNFDLLSTMKAKFKGTEGSFARFERKVKDKGGKPYDCNFVAFCSMHEAEAEKLVVGEEYYIEGKLNDFYENLIGVGKVFDLGSLYITKVTAKRPYKTLCFRIIVQRFRTIILTTA